MRLLPLGLALLASCGQSQPSQPAASPVAGPSAPDRIERARAAIAAEPAVRYVAFLDSGADAEWQVAVDDNGAPRDEDADRICLKLRSFGLVDDRTIVAVLDDARRRAAKGVDVAANSRLGAVRCHDGERVS